MQMLHLHCTRTLANNCMRHHGADILPRRAERNARRHTCWLEVSCMGAMGSIDGIFVTACPVSSPDRWGPYGENRASALLG